MLKIGAVGFIVNRKAVFIPYADFLYDLESRYPSLKIEYKELSTNYQFTREYKYDNIRTYGFRLGIAVEGHTTLFNNEFSSKVSRLSFGLFAGVTCLKSSGVGYYTDTSSTGAKIDSTPIKFNQDSYIINFGLMFGGLDFHW